MTLSLNQLEALNLWGETCLHSTISALWNTYGINFDRVREAHKHRGGGITYLVRYTLQKRHRARAINLLKSYGVEVSL